MLHAGGGGGCIYPRLFGKLPGADVTYGGDVQQVDLVVLVHPAQVESLRVDTHRDRCAGRRVLRIYA